MKFEGYSELISIYWDYLSYSYVLCVCTSIIAVLMTFFYRKRSVIQDENSGECVDGEGGVALGEEEEEKAQLDSAISLNLTPDEIRHEKEVEAKQLNEIYKLLAQNKGKFNINSLKDLEEQMKFYR